MSALEWLDAVRADLDAATPGPWRAALLDGVDYDDGSSSYRGGIYPAHIGAPPIILTNGVDRQDATLIASAPDRLDKMERALRTVLDRHSATEYEDFAGNTGVGCWQCGTDVFPCPAVAEIQEALR